MIVRSQILIMFIFIMRDMYLRVLPLWNKFILYKDFTGNNINYTKYKHKTKTCNYLNILGYAEMKTDFRN